MRRGRYRRYLFLCRFLREDIRLSVQAGSRIESKETPEPSLPLNFCEYPGRRITHMIDDRIALGWECALEESAQEGIERVHSPNIWVDWASWKASGP